MLEIKSCGLGVDKMNIPFHFISKHHIKQAVQYEVQNKIYAVNSSMNIGASRTLRYSLID